MLYLTADNQFASDKRPEGLGVYATQVRGRWQFRTGPAKTDSLLASGGTPAQFAKRFWYRDDFTESE